MLENQIKSLSEAVIANTAVLEKVLAALTSTDAKPQIKAATHASLSERVEEIAKADVKTKAKTVKAKPAIEPELEPEPETAADIVTASDLKQLAKDAIADGVLRTDIKKLITQSGADTISALDDDQRLEVYNALTKLRGE